MTTTAKAVALDKCSCGAVVPAINGATHPYIVSAAGCWAVYGQILAREYGDPRYFAVHRLTVDCYALQHPGKAERRVIQSVNAHLVGLHMILERNSSAGFARRTIGVVAERLHAALEWLQPPETFGRLTVEDVVAARNADEHRTIVRNWAAEVWKSWTPHHETIRTLASRAIARM